MPNTHAILLAVALLSHPSAAQSSSEAPDNSTQLQRLSWLVGSWVGGVEMPGYGAVSFRYELSWTLNKNFIKQDYWMKSGDKEVWHDTGMIGWDKDKKEFATFSFGFDGTIGGGRQMDPRRAGVAGKRNIEEALVFDGKTTGNGPFKRYRFILVKGKNDTLGIEVQALQRGRFAPVYKAVATRDKKAAAGKKDAEKKDPRTENPAAPSEQARRAPRPRKKAD